MEPMSPPPKHIIILGTELATYGWVVLLAVWGGVVNYINKVRSGETSKFNLLELIGDIVTSGFVGTLTFWLCQASGFSPLLTAIFVGISGHMGSRAAARFETFVGDKIEQGVAK